MSIDTIGNFLTIIRNGIMASKPFVLMPYAKMRQSIAQILKDEGFIRDFAVIADESNDISKKQIKVLFKFVDGESVIHEITRISKPSRRSYSGSNEIKPVINGLGLSILTTSKGVVTHKKAVELGVGGEVICTVW
ncbi:MAG: 30S ribosomal protein S8 [Candidatus Babeliales bacterium]|nr:30S ribosomal protein S8 [Candidatus Babeliales bacterium]